MKSKTYTLSRVIHVSQDTLFKLVSDFDSYAAWNTVVTHAHGELLVGTDLLLTINMDGKSNLFRPKVLSINRNERFVLSKTFGNRFIGELSHHFLFVKLSDSSTEFVQMWKGRGVFVWILWPLIKRGFLIFEKFNDDLEKHASFQN